MLVRLGFIRNVRIGEGRRTRSVTLAAAHPTVKNAGRGNMLARE